MDQFWRELIIRRRLSSVAAATASEATGKGRSTPTKQFSKSQHSTPDAKMFVSVSVQHDDPVYQAAEMQKLSMSDVSTVTDPVQDLAWESNPVGKGVRWSLPR